MCVCVCVCEPNRVLTESLNIPPPPLPQQCSQVLPPLLMPMVMKSMMMTMTGMGKGTLLDSQASHHDFSNYAVPQQFVQCHDDDDDDVAISLFYCIFLCTIMGKLFTSHTCNTIDALKRDLYSSMFQHKLAH